MYRFHRAAADAARRSGDTAGAARDLATAATNVYRFSGKFVRIPSQQEAVALITQARELAGDDPAARAAVVLAEAGVLTDAFGSAQGPPDNADRRRSRAPNGRSNSPAVRATRWPSPPRSMRCLVPRAGPVTRSLPRPRRGAGSRCCRPRRILRPEPTS